MYQSVILLLIATFASNSVYAMGGVLAQEIPNFQEVEKDSLYRGGVPTELGLRTLSQMKMKTVLSLRDEDPVGTEEEGRIVSSLGMNFISIPLSGFLKPKQSKMDAIEAVLEDSKYRPLFVHCAHGRDRTGLVIGLFRVFAQGVDPQIAYQEMLEYGFREYLLGLRYYFRDKTGY